MKFISEFAGLSGRAGGIAFELVVDVIVAADVVDVVGVSEQLLFKAFVKLQNFNCKLILIIYLINQKKKKKEYI